MTSNRIRAERALLGAVLADPPAHHHLLDVLEPDDFERSWHAQVLAAMQRVRARGAHPEALAVYAEIQEDADLPACVARDGVLLANLIEASPRPGHAPAYAAMVVEGGIRQRLDLAGARLAQARQAGDLGAALHQACQTSAVIDACQSRWTALPDVIRSQLPAVLRGQPVRPMRIVPRAGRAAVRTSLLARDSAAARSRPRPRVSPVTARLHHAIADQETHLNCGRPSDDVSGARALRDLIAAPSQIALVRGWLRPEHFARPEHGQLYAVLRDLHAFRQPVDQLTVTWQAGRCGITADPASLSGGTGAFAVSSARDVYRLAMLARVERAALGIQADAADAAKSPPQLLKSAAARISALEPELSQDRQLLPGLMTDRSTEGYRHSPRHTDREAEK